MAWNGCRVDVTGLAGLAVGAVLELDAGTVEPRRFAVVETVEGDVAHAVTIGSWSTCAACWPTVGSCEDAAQDVVEAADAAKLVDHAVCPEGVTERLRALIPPPPPPKPIRKRRR